MSRASVLQRGRTAAEAGMLDACTIRREDSVYVEAGTGNTTSVFVTIYQGKCRIQQAEGASQARREDAGEASLLMVPRVVHLPVATSTGVRADDLVTIDTCSNDPDLIGRVFRVRQEMGKSEATARRLGVEEVTS